MYTYTYVHIEELLSAAADVPNPSLVKPNDMCIYIYIHTCIYLCIYIYI